MSAKGIARIPRLAAAIFLFATRAKCLYQGYKGALLRVQNSLLASSRQ